MRAQILAVYCILSGALVTWHIPVDRKWLMWFRNLFCLLLCLLFFLGVDFIVAVFACLYAGMMWWPLVELEIRERETIVGCVERKSYLWVLLGVTFQKTIAYGITVSKPFSIKFRASCKIAMVFLLSQPIRRKTIRRLVFFVSVLEFSLASCSTSYVVNCFGFVLFLWNWVQNRFCYFVALRVLLIPPSFISKVSFQFPSVPLTQTTSPLPSPPSKWSLTSANHVQC